MTSTAGAEYLALCSAVQESVWPGRVFAFAKKLSFPPQIVIDVDNQGSIEMARIDISGDRTRPMDVKYYLIRTLLHKRKLKMKYCLANRYGGKYPTKTFREDSTADFQRRRWHIDGHVASCQRGSVGKLLSAGNDVEMQQHTAHGSNLILACRK